ncbi:MAG: DUF11 domain-containing protein, partial [Actinobacteria bacterium]|nr:DUF11 domain-containing protein [Actinomycetota bacterium]
MTVRGTVNAPVGTTINNTATASGVITTTTTTTVNGSATASTLVSGAAPGLPDLTIAIQAPASTPRGGTIVYTVTVQNQGGTNVTGAVAVFNIPAGLTFVSAVGSSNFVCTNNAGQVTCTGGAITAGGNATITVQASVPAAQPLGPVTATAVIDPNNAITESNEQNNTAQAVTQIVAPRGGNGGTLVIQKTANPSPTVLTGQQLTYQIVVTNTSSSPATNVTVTDATNGLNNATIVANTTLGNCAVAANVVTCSVPGMTPQQVMTITITGAVTAAAGATITNTATVTGTINGAGVNNSSTAVTQVAGGAGPADLVVTKSGPQTVTAGQQFVYTLTVSNLGGTLANGVRVEDTLPAGVQLQSAIGDSGFQCLARVQPPQAVCTGGSIAAGGSATLTLTVLAPNAVGTITNTAVVDPLNTIPETNDGNNTATFMTQVTAVPGTPPSPLAVFKNGTPNPVVPGQTLTWTIDITNISSLAAGAITVSDGTTGLDAASVMATTTIGSCTVTASQVNCNVPGLPAGQSMQVVISGTVVAQAGTSINNTVDVSGLTGRTPFTSTAQATVNVRPRVDLNISKSNTSPVIAGAPFQYIITVGNSGLSQVTGVEVRDVLPPGVIFNSAVAPAFAGGCTAAGQVVTCTGGTIPPSSTVTITLNVIAPQTTGTIVNTATVDPNNTIPETDEMNNSTTLNTVVATGIDLIPTKCDGDQANNTNPAPAAACPAGSGPDPVAPLGTLTYNRVISNIGTQNATNVEVLDVLPVEVTFVSAIGTNGFTCVQGGVNVTCTGGVINFGTSATITIVVTAPNAPTTVQNEVTVDPNNTIAETNEGNNIASALTVVAPVANLQTVKCDGNTANDPVNPNIPLATRTAACAANAATAGPDPVAPGTPLRYILVISNTSALAANNVLVRDSLPPGVTFTNAVGTNNFTCFVNGTFIDCSGGNIPAMSVATITINVAVNNNV